jgi:hypothetical protein
MKTIEIISQDVFDKIRSRFSNLEMGDENGEVTMDPRQSRFYDFDFAVEGKNLGRVSISINELGTLKVFYGQSILEDAEDDSKDYWYDFLREMRLFAKARLLRFDTRDITKSNLNKDDFQYLATNSTKEETMNMSESAKFEGGKKTSYRVLEKTKLIAKHHKSIEDESYGARSRSNNIKALYIENSEGERFKYPFIHIAGAKAMQRHVANGGRPYDEIGNSIIKMSEHMAALTALKRNIGHDGLNQSVNEIAERTNAKLEALRHTIHSICNQGAYEGYISSYTPVQEATDLDPATVEDYKSKFTVNSFKEDLLQYFPLIHSIMQEAGTVDLEDYVSESPADDPTHQDPDADDKRWDDVDEDRTETKDKDGNVTSWMEKGEWKKADKKDPKGKIFNLSDKARRKTEKMAKTPAESIENFEEWAEAVEQGKLTDDEVNELKQALEQLPQGANGPELELGPNGGTAWQFFSGLGLDDSELEKKLEAAAELDPETDPLEVMTLWAKEHYPELLVTLGISGEEGGEQQPPAPEAGAAPAPAQPPAPEQPTAENEEMKGREQAMPTRESIVQEVAKIVKSFYNRDNPEVGPFRGAENITLDCKKKIAEKFGDKAGEFAEGIAGKFIEKLTNEWQQKHGQVANGHGDDGLARLKELLGNVKAKVEGIGQSEMEEKDNWHPSKHVTDPQKRKELAPHDKDVQRGSYADRAAYLDKGGVPKSENAEMESILRLVNYKK